MRSLPPALLAAAVLATLPAAAAGEEPRRIELKPGDSVRLGGNAPICDDPSVAWISADGAGVLHAGKEGTTLCSLAQGPALGIRQVYRVVVKAPPPPPKAPEPVRPSKGSEDR